MNNFSFVIMAGGEGKRFGKDKTKALLNGKELFIYSVEKGIKMTDDVIIVSRNKEKYKPFINNVKYIEDEYENQCPMAGMITVSNYAKYDNIFIISADTPLLSTDVIEIIISNLNSYDGVIPVINGKSCNLSAIYKKNTLKSLLPFYEKGIYKLNISFKDFNILYLDETYFHKYNINKEFLNINTINDLENAKKFISNT